MSSYAVLHILREEYDLVTQATSLSPNDTIILNNLCTMNMWLDHYEKASVLNHQLIKAEPNVSQHIIPRALFDKLFLS
jgi:Flp pilus assembly protein TadD